MKWLAANQITLKSEILTPDIIIGLRSDTLSKTKQCFYFLVARTGVTYGPAEYRKCSQK